MKEDILQYLRKEKFVAGPELADQLDVSKVAIWKNIQSLKEEGYKIESKQGRGYRLLEPPETLTPYEIKKRLDTEFVGKNVTYHEKIASTQRAGKRLARNEVEEGTIVIAESQTGGKGRKNRSWISPEGGLYISIILKPHITPSQAPIISLLTGIAVAKAIREDLNLKAKLKWPNDIKIKEKKTGGILLEISAETDQINWLVIGIGLNVNNRPSDEEVKNRTTSLKEETGGNVPKLNILKKILENLEELYLSFEEDGADSILKDWKKLSSTLGSFVHVSDGEEIEGKAVDVSDNGALILELEDERQKKIFAGDVSLRKKIGPQNKRE